MAESLPLRSTRRSRAPSAALRNVSGVVANAPLAAPCMGFVLGVCLSRQMSHVPIAALSLCVTLGLSWRSRAGVVLAATAAGVLHGALVWVLPLRQLDGFDSARPVAVVLAIRGPWQETEWGWEARGHSTRLRQGLQVKSLALRAPVSVGGTSPPPAGVRLRARGYLARGEPAANDQPDLPARYRWLIKSARLVEVDDSRVPLPLRLRSWTRHRLRLDGEGASGDTPGVALVEALLFGDASHLDEELRSSLYRLGLGHVLAVSGLHVGLLLVPLLRSLGECPPLLRLLLATPVPLLYLCLAGGRPALCRVSAVVLVLLLAGVVSRPACALNSLAAVLAGLVVLEPSSVEDLALQLTFAASAAIVLLSGPIRRALERPWKAVSPWRALEHGALSGVAVSVAAQIGTLPFSLWTFSWFAPGATLLNLMIVPWTAVTLAVVMGVAGVALVLGNGIDGFAPLLDSLVLPFDWSSRLPPVPWFGLPLDPRDPVIWLGVLVLAPWVVPRGAGARGRLAISGLVFALWMAIPSGAPREEVELFMLDVGQGEAFLLRDGEAAVLIDGGGWRRGDLARSVLIPALARLEVRRIDLLLVTHGDTDHCRGATQLLSYIPVRAVWLGAGELDRPCGRGLSARAGDRLEPIQRGRRAEIGSLSLEVLAPAGAERSGNDGSVVLAVKTGSHRLLFTGDITARIERELIAGRADLSSDILKVAHHGSKTSTLPAWLNAVSPRLALVSAGVANRYGHPSPRVLERLSVRGAPVLRTDRHGRVRIALERDAPLRISVVGRR